MKLYTLSASPNSRRAMATALQLGVDVEVVTVNLMKGEHRTPEFLAINPNGKVPALVDGELRLWESTAIMHYLAMKTPGQTLLPEDPAARADVLRWQAWDLTTFSPTTAPVVYERVFTPMMGGTPDEERIATLLTGFRKAATLLEAHLQGRQWLVGDGLTLADFSVGAVLTYAIAAQLPLAEFPAIEAWRARLERVPAWAETMPRLG